MTTETAESLETIFPEILKAKERLSPILEKTPLIKSYTLSTPTQEVFLKMENLQRTGSFKVRGAFNKVASLSEEERKRGIICSSAGNHAQGVALGGQYFHVPAYICMPKTTPQAKIENTQSYGANVILYGDVYDDAAAKAKELQHEKGYTYIHPFDDRVVIAGQGTLGLEIMEQKPDLDAIVVPIGGGGLICGIAIAAKHQNPNIKIIGVQASGAAAMVESVHEGKRITLSKAKTIADGIQVREPGVLTFELIRKYVDELVTVEESELHAAILYLLEKQHIVTEGAGATPTAAFLAGKIKKEYKKLCLLCSGGNIDINMVNRVIDRGLKLQNRRFRIETRCSDKPGELGKLMKVLGDQNANIFQMEQTRQLEGPEMMEQVVEITIELHNYAHKESVLNALKENGYDVKVL